MSFCHSQPVLYRRRLNRNERCCDRGAIAYKYFNISIANGMLGNTIGEFSGNHLRLSARCDVATQTFLLADTDASSSKNEQLLEGSHWSDTTLFSNRLEVKMK